MPDQAGLPITVVYKPLQPDSFCTLGRQIPVELVETVRRGGKTCHLVAHLS